MPGNMPLDRARDTGVSTLRRFARGTQVAKARSGSSSRILRRGNFTGANLDGATVDDDDLAALLSRIQARLRGNVAAAPIALSASAAVYTTIGTPTVQVVNGVAYITGAIAPVGTWTDGSVYPIGTLPTGVTGPTVPINRLGATNLNAPGVRVMVNPSGVLQLVAPATAPAWVDLSTLSGWIPAT